MQKQRPLVGIVVNEPDRSYFSRSLNIIQQELFAADMDAAIFSTMLTRGEEPYTDAENAVFDLINFDEIDGLIVFLYTLNCEKIKKSLTEKIRSSKKPVVFIEYPEEDFDYVPFNNDECAAAIVDHLVNKHNVKTVSYVSGREDSISHKLVENSFRKALGEYGIDIPENRFFHSQDWTDDYGVIAQGIIDSGLPDAVICCSDFTAAAVISELSARGVKVPEDVIVTGYSKNEPFDADYFNITSIIREPAEMSLTAVRKIISQITGKEFVQPEMTSCSFEPGVTCGCAPINYTELSRAALDSMVHTRREGFDSYYNFMSEELIGAADFEDYLWKLNWYTFYLGDFKGFWLCLNDNVMHTDAQYKTYTDKIDIPFMNCDGNGTVDLDRSFDKSLMLPAIYENREEPCAFIFNSLHFSDVNFGYIVLSYGSSGKMYDKTFAKWVRYVTCALEKHHRHMIYNDAVTDAQIRDTLTGLLNMRGFKRVMTDRCGKFDREDKLLRIISVDVENLNGINTAYGYSEGDRILQKLAVILNNCAGDEDICVRVSGDEFLIAGIIDAAVPVDEVPMNLERNLNAYNSGTDSEYGIHLYTSRVTAPLTSPEVLDTLPYEANYQRTLTKDNHNKARKTDSSVKKDDFDPEERKYVSKLLNENLITYNFQPIINAKNGEIYAYEALMRSAGDVKLSPISIINHADAMGRLGDVERLTMQNLFAFVNDNRDFFKDKLLFINSIPSCILPDKDFDELYAKYKDIMNKVVVEFTEQTEASTEQLETILNRSRKVGFKIAIDDYGTGYSNISNLLTFMPNCVKIDRSLIMNIHEDKRKQHFTRNIIDYAHDNDFMVLAEGVELAEELRTVISMGIDLIQGYYTARPNENIISSINQEVADEIKSFSRLSKKRVARKTYFTGGESEISLMNLDFDNYTDILVTSPEFTILGNKNYFSNVAIHIKEGIECTLTLIDVSMKSSLSECCISIGNNSKLRLNIVGDVSIAGSICVPETAELKICGDGTFTMSSTSQHYGIGCDSEHSYGNIGIYLKNKMYIHIDNDKCIAIGGGYNHSGSKINIAVSELVIELSGEKVLGIGSLKSLAIVKINHTNLSISCQCANGIAIGSYQKTIDVEINESEIDINSSGNKIGGICAYTTKTSSVNINHVKLGVLFKGKIIHAIGSDSSPFVITMHDCTMDIVCEGARTIAIGSSSEDTKLSMYDCKGLLAVRSANGEDLFVRENHLIIDRCDIERNKRL